MNLDDDDDEFRHPNFELLQRDRKRYDGGNVVELREGHYCTQCEYRIPEDAVYRLNIVITDCDPGHDLGPEGMERNFCSWECAADWFEIQDGRRAWTRSKPPRGQLRMSEHEQADRKADLWDWIANLDRKIEKFKIDLANWQDNLDNLETERAAACDELHELEAQEGEAE